MCTVCRAARRRYGTEGSVWQDPALGALRAVKHKRFVESAVHFGTDGAAFHNCSSQPQVLFVVLVEIPRRQRQPAGLVGGALWKQVGRCAVAPTERSTDLLQVTVGVRLCGDAVGQGDVVHVRRPAEMRCREVIIIGPHQKYHPSQTKLATGKRVVPELGIDGKVRN
jgi:hypothetical protein